MTAVIPGRPAADEFAPYYATYIDKVPGDDPLAALEAQTAETAVALGRVDTAKAGHRYAPGKWSVREVIGHITDAERVFSYRVLRFARADQTDLPGFDENAWMPHARFDAAPLADLIRAWRVQRTATLVLLRSLDAAAWTRRGTANGKPVSVRALAWIIAGHERHHLGVLRERYGIG